MLVSPVGGTQYGSTLEGLSFGKLYVELLDLGHLKHSVLHEYASEEIKVVAAIIIHHSSMQRFYLGGAFLKQGPKLESPNTTMIS